MKKACCEDELSQRRFGVIDLIIYSISGVTNGPKKCSVTKRLH